MKCSLTFTKQFQKDIKLIEKQGINTKIVYELIYLIASGETLSPKYKDHKLKGFKDDIRECHVKPDLVLVYSLDKKNLILFALRVGSHSDIL